jgi:hypothetical protein
VFAANDPLRVLPVINSIDEVIVCTFIVCAVKVPLTVKLSADDAVDANDELKADNEVILVVVTIFVFSAEPVIVGEYIFIFYL